MQNPYPPIGQPQEVVSEIVTDDISHQLADLSLNIQQPLMDTINGKNNFNHFSGDFKN